jgi:hypothetical protein
MPDEIGHTPSGRVRRVRGKPASDDVLLLGGKDAPTHEPKRTVGERMAGGRPTTAIGWILRRFSFPDKGEEKPKPIKAHARIFATSAQGGNESERAKYYRRVTHGKRSGISHEGQTG